MLLTQDIISLLCILGIVINVFSNKDRQQHPTEFQFSLRTPRSAPNREPIFATAAVRLSGMFVRGGGYVEIVDAGRGRKKQPP